MKSAKLSLTMRKSDGSPEQDSNKEPVQMNFALKFLKSLPLNQSLFQFKFDLPLGQTSTEFKLTSEQASVFFDYMDEVVYSSPGTPSEITVESADSIGNPIGTISIVFGTVGPPLQITFNGSNYTFHVYSFSITGATKSPCTFMLTDSDLNGIFLFFDYILWSNPPNPPH